MTRNQIWSVNRKLDYTLEDNTMEIMTDDIYNKILANTYDFSSYNSEIFTQQNKKRKIYTYDKLSVENVICHYLKKQIDNIFNIRYEGKDNE
jgi:hypothetical protein